MSKPIWIAMIALPRDLLEGCGAGQRGDDLATEYIATQFELAGAKPADCQFHR